MTASEFVTELLAQGPSSPNLALELRLVFRLLRDRMRELTVQPDQHFLTEVGDFADFAGECVEALNRKIPLRAGFADHPLRLHGRVLPQVRWERKCPECDHEHEGRGECKVYLGEGKFCPCEAKVTV